MQTVSCERVFLAYVGVTFGHVDGPSCAKRVAFLDTVLGLVAILEGMLKGRFADSVP